MRKGKIILSLLTSFFVFNANAGEKKIKQGNFRTGSFVNISRTLSGDTEAEALAIDARADINYFIIDKLSLGPIFRYEYQENNASIVGLGPNKSDEFTFGISSNFYFFESEDWTLVTGLSLLTRVNSEDYIYNIHLSAEYFINEAISVGPKLIYENFYSNSSFNGRDAIIFFTGFYFYL